MGSDGGGQRGSCQAVTRQGKRVKSRPCLYLLGALSMVGLLSALRQRSSRVDSFILQSLSAPQPLVPGAELQDGLLVTADDQRLAKLVGIGGDAAAVCRSKSAAGTSTWSVEQFAAAITTAGAYRARGNETLVALSALTFSKPSRWYDAMPLMSACPTLLRYGGNADGGKWLCGLDSLAAPCVIYSLGSNGDFKFEEAMVAATQCDIFSFDCIMRPDKIPAGLHPRIRFEPVCVGSDSPDGRFQSTLTITRRLGHPSLHLLKFDVEGAEFSIVDNLLAAASADFRGSYTYLPYQLSFEVHLQYLPMQPAVRAAKVLRLFQGLLDLGYVPVSRELNLRCNNCEEFVFIRLAAACWPGGQPSPTSPTGA